jgi:hypothetical protein
MKLSLFTLSAVAGLLAVPIVGAGLGASLLSKAPPAPTYYITVQVHECRSTSIEFRGATNLPPSAIIMATVNDFEGDGWKGYSDFVYVPVGQEGFFTGKIEPRKDIKFRHNLLLTVSFHPNVGKQPPNVLHMVGSHGEYLAGVENPSSNLTELSGLSHNPQLFQASGWHYGIETIARVPSCAN